MLKIKYVPVWARPISGESDRVPRVLTVSWESRSRRPRPRRLSRSQVSLAETSRITTVGLPTHTTVNAQTKVSEANSLLRIR